MSQNCPNCGGTEAECPNFAAHKYADWLWERGDKSGSTRGHGEASLMRHAKRELWEEFQSSRRDLTACGLCGNTGVIDTRGRVKTPAGYECGVRAFCICPNGRAWKDAKADLGALETGNIQ